MKLWIKDPMAMATPAPQANSGLLIEDGLITAVLDRPPEAFDEVFDASKLVVLPGLINCYHNSALTLFKSSNRNKDKYKNKTSHESYIEKYSN